MHSDEPQTPDQELEQAFIAESSDREPNPEPTDDESAVAPDPWDAPDPRRSQPLEPLPELRLREERPDLGRDDAVVDVEMIETTANLEPETEAGDEEPPEEPPNPPEAIAPAPNELDDLRDEIAALKRQNQALKAEIDRLKTENAQLASAETIDAQSSLGRLVQEGLSELEKRKKDLQSSIEQLERRRDRVREEMRTTFAGVSQDMAIRVQGFKDYLVGSLQDLAAAAEQLDLPEFEPRARETSYEERRSPQTEAPPNPQFGKQAFQNSGARVRDLLDQYRTRPDYYGPPWQLRRTFEPIHAERISNWLLSQGGRGSIRTMGSRLQNILVASAAISIMRELYRDRVKVLVLANTPERLGEWRRGLQDCLGISRSDFGPSRGVVLFESPEALVQKAERLVDEKELPLIIIDDTEERIALALLQFPLWLAFAPDPAQSSNYFY
jgi:prefoldin subunit 5